MTRCYKGGMSEIEVRSVEARTHGRVLVRRGDPRRLLAGFHGYAESADTHLAELLRIPGAEGWTVVAIQALNRFYNRRTPEVVANWMTSQDRELAIADNLAYVRSVIEDFADDPVARPRLVLAGFSQGASMAYRAAAAIGCDALIILGGDLPPDVIAHIRVHNLPPVLLGRGERDEWFTAEKLNQDSSFLREAGVPVETCVFDGGHEWSDVFRNEAGRFLT
ncbi:MAG: putative esterase [Acidobacteria bacterium]|nr:putative esterase [Acidobacteriota bacterium]